MTEQRRRQKNRYRTSAKGLAAQARYEQTAKGTKTKRKYEQSAKGKRVKQKYQASAKGRRARLAHEVKRIRIGTRWIGHAATVEQAQSIRAYIKRRLHEFDTSEQGNLPTQSRDAESVGARNQTAAD